MEIRTKRLTLRPFAASDVKALQAILGDAETMMFVELPYDLARTEAFLREFCIGRQGALAAALRESGQIIGYLLFKELEPDVRELGWIFRRDCWRKGYAYEACSALARYAFEVLGAHKLVAETIDPVKSGGLMRKLGMRQEGVQRLHTRDNAGYWRDMYLYGLLETDCRSDAHQAERQ